MMRSKYPKKSRVIKTNMGIEANRKGKQDEFYESRSYVSETCNGKTYFKEKHIKSDGKTAKIIEKETGKADRSREISHEQALLNREFNTDRAVRTNPFVLPRLTPPPVSPPPYSLFGQFFVPNAYITNGSTYYL